MRTKISIILMLIMLTLLPKSFAQTEAPDQWEKVAPYNYLYLDGISGTQDMYGFNFLLKSYNKGQYESVNGKEISYTLSQYTIDCEKHRYKIGIIDSYGADGNFVNGDYNKFASFQPIVSGTAVSSVAKKLCHP